MEINYFDNVTKYGCKGSLILHGIEFDFEVEFTDFHCEDIKYLEVTNNETNTTFTICGDYHKQFNEAFNEHYNDFMNEQIELAREQFNNI